MKDQINRPLEFFQENEIKNTNEVKGGFIVIVDTEVG